MSPFASTRVATPPHRTGPHFWSLPLATCTRPRRTLRRGECGLTRERMRLSPGLVVVQHGDAFRIEPRVPIAPLQAKVIHIVVDGLVAVAEDRLVGADLVVASPDGTCS